MGRRIRGPVTRMAGALIMTIVLVTFAACGNDQPTVAEPSPSTTAEGALSGDLKVFAAASLTDAFTALGEQLEDANPGLEVVFNFAASSALVQQIEQGAEADVFASADESNMAKLADADPALVEDATVFARNSLAIAVGKGNPKNIESLADLAEPGTIVVLCGEQVPCGKFADEALAKAGVTVEAASREENVKAVLTKVQFGEADAGIVYVTDVFGTADDVQGVDIPDDQNVIASYPIAVTNDAKNAAAARAFIELVTSAAGTEVLEGFGFKPPA